MRRGTLATLALGVVVLVAAVLVAYRPDLIGLARPAANPAPASAGTRQANAYKVDAVELYLIPMQRVEYKYQLAKGATMLYTWKADATVYFDMHNVPEGRPINESVRIEEGEGDQAHGVYTAPYPGLHGWFWENRGTNPVLIQLKTAGFYTGALMISDGEQIPMELQDPPAPKEP